MDSKPPSKLPIPYYLAHCPPPGIGPSLPIRPSPDLLIWVETLHFCPFYMAFIRPYFSIGPFPGLLKVGGTGYKPMGQCAR